MPPDITNVHPQIIDLVKELVGSSPDKLLPAHQRYALSMVADGQGQRTQSDEFTKAAGQGVNPEAFASNRAADKMAAAVGIQPPPMPAPVADGTASNPAFKESQAQGAMPSNTQSGPTNPPPNTYYDVDRKISVYDPNYHGAYQPIHGLSKGASPNDVAPGAIPHPQDANGNPIDQASATGAGVPVARVSSNTTPLSSGYDERGDTLSGGMSASSGYDDRGDSGATIATGTSMSSAQQPIHQYAKIDQAKIDDAWTKFDQAMSQMPHPPDPAKLPEIGLAQVFAMAAAGLIDPMAGAVIGKALFDAPVMAKQLIDQNREKQYQDSVKMWQNNTQRTLQAASNVERAEVNKQHNLQTTYDKDFDIKSGTYNTAVKARGAGLRKMLGTIDSQIRNATTMLQKSLTGEEKDQWTAKLNDLYQHQTALQNDILGVESGGQSQFFSSDGKPTPAYEKMQADIAYVAQKTETSKANEGLIEAKTGLVGEQAERMRQLLPHEIDKMVAQTEGYNASTVRSLWAAMESVQRIKNGQFDQEIKASRFRLDEAKAQVESVNKILGIKRSEYEKAQNLALKEQSAADKIQGNVLNFAGGKWLNDAAKASYESHMKSAEEARRTADGLGGAGGTIDTLSATSSILQDALKVAAPTPNTGTTPSIGEMKSQAGGSAPTSKIESFVAAANQRIGKPYKWGAGRAKGADSEMDCSGLVCDAAEAAGFKPPGSTAQEQMQNTQEVTDKPVRGDLLFFNWKGGNKATHVGIYLGGNSFIEASSSSGKVKTSTLNDEKLKHLIRVGRMNPDASGKSRPSRGKKTLGMGDLRAAGGG